MACTAHISMTGDVGKLFSMTIKYLIACPKIHKTMLVVPKMLSLALFCNAYVCLLFLKIMPA